MIASTNFVMNVKDYAFLNDELLMAFNGFVFLINDEKGECFVRRKNVGKNASRAFELRCS